MYDVIVDKQAWSTPQVSKTKQNKFYDLDSVTLSKQSKSVII